MFARIRSLWQSMRHRSQLERDLDDEMRFHLEARADDLVRTGLSRPEALRRARLEFGFRESYKDRCRESRRVNWAEDLAQDVRFGLRTLRKSPGFTAIATLTLALGIGANTTIFSAADGIFLDPLPYADASHLVTIARGQVAWGLYPEEIEDLQKQCPAFDRVTVYAESTFGYVHSGDDVTPRKSTYVPADFFFLLGVKPLLGRVIVPQDSQPGNEHVAVLSYLMWRDMFGGDDGIIGRKILIGNSDQSRNEYFTVIGVMPREFELGIDWLGEKTEGLWEPLVPAPMDRHGRVSETILARLKKGASIAEARAEVKTISARFAPLFPPGSEHIDLSMKNLQRYSTSDIQDLRTAFLILLGAVGFVLLLACVNLSALLTARAWARQKEIAIRQTLGASHLRILRQLLAESLLLALAGGALGLLLSIWGIRVILAILPPGTPRLDRVVINARVLWFTLTISILAAILFGLAPALQRSARRFGRAFAGGLRGSFAGPVTRERRRLRSVLVIAEVALAVVLVTGGALMVRSFEKLIHQNMGFRTDHVLTMQVQLSQSNCGEAVTPKKKDDSKDKSHSPGRKNNAAEGESQMSGDQKKAPAPPKPCPTVAEALTGLQSLKEIENAGFESYHEESDELIVEGGSGEPISNSVELDGGNVGPGYFSAMGIRLLRGRDFVADDARSDQKVAIVSEGFARRYFPGDPLGRRFRVKFEHYPPDGPWMQIIGVVNDVRLPALVSSGYEPDSYYMPIPNGAGARLVVRTSIDPMPMATSVERVVHAVDSRAAITELKTMDQVVTEAAAEPRFQTVLLGSFSALGLLLALIGIYGVISYDVVQRTHEIGVRMALGATPADALRLIIREGMALAVVGIAIGIAGALALTRFLTSFLFEIKPNDPATFGTVAAALALAALAASWIPARRAMRVDPMVALRHE